MTLAPGHSGLPPDRALPVGLVVSGALKRAAVGGVVLWSRGVLGGLIGGGGSQRAGSGRAVRSSRIKQASN
jgi:hypothetical protein